MRGAFGHGLAILLAAAGLAIGDESLLGDAPLVQPESVAACDDCQGCDYCSPVGRCGRLFGLFAPSDDRFYNFISPMTNPVFFEDPRTLTEVRTIFLQNRIPNRAPLAGGDVQLFAAQFRVALSDRLSIIATKDGFITTGADGPHDDGFADVAAGLKYNLYADPDSQQIVSAGLVYEMPVGSRRALQGNGSGEFNLFLTGGTQVGELSHLVSAAGFRLPADYTAESRVFYWSAHADRQLPCTNLYGLIELNWYHWMGSGQGGIPGIEGLDLYNFGSTGVSGNDIVTGAIGTKWKVLAYSELGLAFEVPLTDRRDILDNRITADFILRY